MQGSGKSARQNQLGSTPVRLETITESEDNDVKKRLAWISLLLVCLMMLASCSSLIQALPEPENAQSLSRRISAKMATVKSYRVDVQMDFTLLAQGTPIVCKLSSIMIEDKSKGVFDYYSYTEIENDMTVGEGRGSNILVKSIDAYCDGRAFSSYSRGKAGRKIYSKMAATDYIQFRAGDNDIVEMDYADCENAEFQKNDSGYTVTYSGYSDNALMQLTKAAGLSADMLDDSLRDMRVTITTDDTYLPSTISLELIFDVAESAEVVPCFVMTMTFSQYNAVERLTDKLDTRKYTEIEDLRILKDLEAMINGIADQKQGTIKRDVQNKVEYLGRKQTDKQSDTATFSNSKDGFVFEMDIDSGGAGTKIKYSEGCMRIRQDGDWDSTYITDQQAKDQLRAMIGDPMSYDYTLVTNLEKTEDGYLVSMVIPKDNVVVLSLIQAGGQFSSGTQTVEIKIVKDKIVSMSTTYQFKGSLPAGGNNIAMSFSGTIDATFEY